ncbi:MAG TPA: hypothetical protein VFD51_02755 [Patescibacteria group bacterium]|nr:hypothetical protein [Patescibacteria group bacterium]
MVLTWLTNLILLFFSLIFNFTEIANVQFSGLIMPESIISQSIISADKAAVLSADGRYLFFSKQAEEVQPIASITKLMTAMVFLETRPNFTDTYKIRVEDNILGGKLHLFLGDTVNLKDLFLTSLVASDNGATIALVHSSGLSEEEFIKRMNIKAKDLRLLKTEFADPIGLSEKNVSSAREVSLMTLAAFKVDMIKEALSLKDYTYSTAEGREKFVESTDYLLFDTEEIGFSSLGGKTGYTDQAGYCFSGMFEGPSGEMLVATVLNSEGRNGRFKESKTIINWVINAYSSNK